MKDRFTALCAFLDLTVVDADDLTYRDNGADIENAEREIAARESQLRGCDSGCERCEAIREDIETAREELADAIATVETADAHGWGCYGEGVTFEIDGQEWAVLTDAEADRAFRESIESYVEDCLDLPEIARRYFDMEAFARDCELSDGRGHSLASYDGAEECETANGVDFFLYRLS